MQQLMGEKVNPTNTPILRELFSQGLPANVRMILASNDTKDIEEMAQLADKIMEVATPVPPSLVSLLTRAMATNSASKLTTFKD